ncbi:MAG: LacI family DNA-binding transcriptional regulator [Lentisphaeria bacterium]|nr:MAG: LacI family DNA-binding transcriptional regulator [Lentisphaeria bacterium]
MSSIPGNTFPSSRNIETSVSASPVPGDSRKSEKIALLPAFSFCFKYNSKINWKYFHSFDESEQKMSANGNLTIKDIARACGVGLGTVSRAINGKPGVKQEVRKRFSTMFMKWAGAAITSQGS